MHLGTVIVLSLNVCLSEGYQSGAKVDIHASELITQVFP